jgi:hypothetical protein
MGKSLKPFMLAKLQVIDRKSMWSLDTIERAGELLILFCRLSEHDLKSFTLLLSFFSASAVLIIDADRRSLRPANGKHRAPFVTVNNNQSRVFSQPFDAEEISETCDIVPV